MNTSLPPVPADLWPKVIAAGGKRPPGRMLTLEIPAFSEGPLLDALSRSIHLEMRSAGEWAARIGSASDKDFPSAKEISRHSAEYAARLHSIYAALHASAEYRRSFDLAPQDLKAAATRSYQAGFRESRERQQEKNTSYNDALYQTMKPGAAHPKPAPHRP